MQTATFQTESESLDLSLCVHHYTLSAPCPKGQGMTIVLRMVLVAPIAARVVRTTTCKELAPLPRFTPAGAARFRRYC